VPDDNNSVNGKAYKWVAPDVNNIPQGNYEPVILLIAPKKQQLVTIEADYMLSNNTKINTALALSNYNINAFSSKDKGDDIGYAAKFTLTNLRTIKKWKKHIQLTSHIGYEWVEDRFKPIERLRTVEFYRNWGLPITVNAATENLFTASAQLSSISGNAIQYKFENYQRSDGYSGVKNSILQKADIGNWHFNNQLNITNFNLSDQTGYYVKPVLDISKSFPALGNYSIGAGYTLERNFIKYKQIDSLNISSFAFDTWQVYIKSPAAKPNKWGVTYYTRSDSYPYAKNLLKADRSNNINAYTELLKSAKHQLRINITYRKLNILDDKINTAAKAEETILGRTEYFINEFKGMINGNALYEIGTGQEQKRDFTYIEVPAGQGEYTWNDYNADGIQQLNEFEVSQFKDQAKYIRIFTPTNQYIKANYLQFNYSLIINPRAFINTTKAGGFQKFFTRVYFQSSLQIYKKEMSGSLSFNPFSTALSDTSLIILTKTLSNSFSFNRSSSVWGLDLNNIKNDNKSFLTYGYESRKLNEWNIRSRWNITRNFLFELTGKNTLNSLTTPSFDNKNYNIKGIGTEPKISFIRNTNFRILLGYKFDDKTNTDSTQKAIIHSLTSEVKYNLVSNTSVTAKFTYSQIKYSDAANGNSANTSVAYIMLDALLPGKNFLWTVDLTKRLTSYLELNFVYEGRKAAASNTVHIGRATLRAIF
jgi:uncharacterized protein YxeA